MTRLCCLEPRPLEGPPPLASPHLVPVAASAALSHPYPCMPLIGAVGPRILCSRQCPPLLFFQAWSTSDQAKLYTLPGQGGVACLQRVGWTLWAVTSKGLKVSTAVASSK